MNIEYSERVLQGYEQLKLSRIKSHFKRDQDWIYTEVNHPEWIINRVIAICKFRPLAYRLIGDFPVEENPRISYKVPTWEDNIGYCGDELGSYCCCSDLPAALDSLGEYSSVAAKQIWELSERLQIPLGQYAEVVFSRMIEAEGVKVG